MDIVVFGSVTARLPRTPSTRPQRASCATSTTTTPVTGWSIEAIARWLNEQRRGHVESRSPVGALDGAADAAQPDVSRHGLLREDTDSPRSGPAEARNTETAAIGPRTSRYPRPADVRSGSDRIYTESLLPPGTPSMCRCRSREHRPRAQPGHGPASSVSRRSWPTCSGLRSSPNAASDDRSWRPIAIASSCCIAGAARWPSRNVTSGKSARIESPVRPVAYEPTGPWHRVSGNGRTTSAATRIIVVRHHARSAARHRRTSWT